MLGEWESYLLGYIRYPRSRAPANMHKAQILTRQPIHKSPELNAVSHHRDGIVIHASFYPKILGDCPFFLWHERRQICLSSFPNQVALKFSRDTKDMEGELATTGRCVNGLLQTLEANPFLFQ